MYSSKEILKKYKLSDPTFSGLLITNTKFQKDYQVNIFAWYTSYKIFITKEHTKGEIKQKFYQKDQLACQRCVD